MVEIKKNLVNESRYGLKCPYAMAPKYVVIHNTYNDACAANEIAYMRRNNSSTSFHYAVDDKEIVQGIPENRNAWHAGDGSNGEGNRRGIAIEICYSKSGGNRFIKAEKNAAEFAASILKRYGWGIDRLKKHQDFNGKNCPHRTIYMGWNRFVDMVRDFMDADKKFESTDAAAIVPNAVVTIAKGAKWYNNGKDVPGWVIDERWVVSSISGNRVVVDRSENGRYDINSPIDIKYLTPTGFFAPPPVVNTVDGKIDGARTFNKAKAGKYKVKATNGLRLRSGASTSKKIIETLKYGAIVTCHGYYTKEWLLVVSEKGNIGFCHGDYLTKV